MAEAPLAVGRRPPLDPRLVRRARAARPALAVAVAVGGAQAATTVVQAVALATVLARAFAGRSGATGGPLVALAGAVAARAALGYVGEVAAARGATAVRRELRSALVDAVGSRGPDWVAARRTGELTVALTSGVDALDDYFGRLVPQLAVAVVAPAVVGAWVLGADWLSAVILGATVAVLPVFMVLLGAEAEERMHRQWHQVERLGGHFLDVVQGLATLRLFNRARAQLDAVAAVTDRLRRTTLDTLRVAFLSSLVLELLASLSTALVALVLGLRLAAGKLPLATALAVLLVAPEIYLPLRRASAQFHAAAEGVGAGDRILGLLDEADGDRPAGRRPVRTGRPPAVVADGLTVRRPGRPRPVLDGLQLAVAPGEHVALVGPSGVGKTTLLACLLGLVVPEAGAVLVDGEPLSELDLAAWRARCGWAPQRPTLFAGTVADNLRLGAPDAGGDAVARALAVADADRVVDGLPGGLDAVVTDGDGLSAGQRQRLGLARAFVRRADLYLLDEPTAHLDAASRRRVATALRAAAAGATMVVATHDEDLAAGFDRLVRLHQSPAVAAGG